MPFPGKRPTFFWRRTEVSKLCDSCIRDSCELTTTAPEFITGLYYTAYTSIQYRSIINHAERIVVPGPIHFGFICTCPCSLQIHVTFLSPVYSHIWLSFSCMTFWCLVKASCPLFSVSQLSSHWVVFQFSVSSCQLIAVELFCLGQSNRLTWLFES